MSTILPELILTPDLPRRSPRQVDLHAENTALSDLAREFAGPGGNVFQPVAEAILRLCRAHSAGISLIEGGGTEAVFRWVAVCGAWAGYQGGSMPRNASPCGLVVDTKAWQLMGRPAAHFPEMKDADPPVVEVLLVPFQVLDETVGTVWAISHDAGLVFDSEDLRVMENLAEFAGAAYRTRERLKRDHELRDEISRSSTRLTQMNEKLWQRLESDNKEWPTR